MPADAIPAPIFSFSSRTPQAWLVWSCAIILTLLVGLLDYRTGYDVSVALVYSAPILFMVWFADRVSAVFIAILCAIVWWWADEAAGHHYVQNWHQVWETVARLIYFILFVVGGSAIKSRLELLEHTQHLEQEIIRISEREQQRIGRDLHDGICQYLAAIGCAAGSLKRNLDKQGLNQAQRAGEIEELIMKGVAQTRGLARGLFPVENDESGLQSALQKLAADASRLLNLHCTFECDSPAPIFDNASATHLYRIAQESVSNASRHGKAKSVAIQLSATPHEVCLSITDDGAGFSPASTGGKGLGLGIMRVPRPRHRRSILDRSPPRRGDGSPLFLCPSHMKPPSDLPSNRPSRVLLVEDHAMFREQLAQLISQEFEMEICGQTDNIQDALTLARQVQPDIAIIDITLKGSSGLELLKDWKAQGLRFPTLVLSMHEESLYAERVLAAGARGYITKHENSETLLRAIHRVLEGKTYVSEQMMENLVGKMAGRGSAGSPVERLADRELEVFQLIGSGRSTREIAESLHLGMTTVDTYRTRIKEKLGLSNGTELIKCASRWVLEGV